MKRLQRLYAVVEFLRARSQQPVTVGQLAEHFGVSERTVFRDVSALREQDVPIYGEPGQQGGMWLGGEYSMPPIGLSIGEAVGFWLAFRMTQSQHPARWRTRYVQPSARLWHPFLTSAAGATSQC